MAYGNESNSASYDDSSDYFVDAQNNEQSQQAGQEQAQQPAFDPNKYVPVEKYQAIEDWKQQAEPKLAMLDRLGSVFNPAPQIDPEQQRVNDFVARQAQEALKPTLDPVTQRLEGIEMQMVSQATSRLGFESPVEAQSWALLICDSGLQKAARNGDRNAEILATNLLNLNNKGNWLGMAQYVENNWDALNKYAGAYAKTTAPKAQMIGHSFGNNNFTNPQSSPQATFATLQQKAGEYRDTDPQKYAEVLLQMRQLALGA
jgi:hypothetical protein